jgi:glycosyltransferase involved in cell wall biosynthesis
MKKIKILFLSHSALINGAEVCLLTLLKYLDRTKYEGVAVLPGDGPLREKVEALGCRCHVTPLEWWIRSSDYRGCAEPRLASRLESLTRIVDLERPDLIHTNTSVIWEGALVARSLAIPHLWHIHEILDGHPNMVPVFPLELVYRVMDHLSSKVVPVSRASMRQFPPDFPVEKLTLIHNGVDTEIFRRENIANSLRDELGLGSNEALAVTVGSLTECKDHDNLLKAILRVQEVGAAVQFLIVGGGSAEAEAALHVRIRELGIEQSVRYLGFRQDVQRILNGSDLLVLPSRHEAFPLVILEAMAVGKPVVATDCGGPAEILEEGVSGYLVPARSPDALAQRILELIRDPLRMKAMGDAGLRRFAENFGPEVYARKFTFLFDELAATGTSPSSPEEEVFWDVLPDLYERCSRKDIDLKKQEETIRNLERELDSHRLHLQRLLQSRSWKVTRPLRGLSSLLRRAGEAAEEHGP